MNRETSSGESTRPGAMPGTTLQAILQRSDGAMDSVAVPVPLPEVVLRVNEASPHTETLFRRAKSGDSVLRYVEESEGPASAAAALAARRCGRCHGARSLYFVAKLAAHAPLTSDVDVYCVDCYGSPSA